MQSKRGKRGSSVADCDYSSLNRLGTAPGSGVESLIEKFLRLVGRDIAQTSHRNIFSAEE